MTAPSLTCRSKLSRVAKAVTTAAPDIVYDTDTMQKQCLVTKVEASPILYANMSRSKVQRAGLLPSSSSPAEIGPGAYDCPVRSDVRASLVLNQNPLSRCGSKLCFAGCQIFGIEDIEWAETAVRCLYSCLWLAACYQGHRDWQLTRWIQQRTWEALGSKRGTQSTGAGAKQFARRIQGCSSLCKVDVVTTQIPRRSHVAKGPGEGAHTDSRKIYRTS